MDEKSYTGMLWKAELKELYTVYVEVEQKRHA